MKKLLLLSFAASLFAGVNAQNLKVGPPSKKIIMEQNYLGKPVKLAPNPMLKKGLSTGAKTSAISVVPLATGPNAFGSIGIKTQVWADPTLNAISFIHRDDPTVHSGESSGDFRFDYSKDGGNTWTLDIGRCYTSSGANADSSIAFSIARYPQGGITNPSGNTNPDSAFMSWYGPSRDGSNPDPANSGDWGGHVYGSYQLASVDTGRQEEVHSDIANGYANLIPRGHAITKVGTCFNLDFSALQDGGDYLDKMVLTKGVWNNAKRDYDYTRSLVNIPVAVDNANSKLISDFKISFADNGNIGYISVIGHDDLTTYPDSINYFIIYKTTDAGASWAGPYRVFLSNVDPLLLNVGAGQLYTTGFEHDAAVDVNNNLHIAVAVGPDAGGFSISTGAGQWGIFDIHTTDGGATWKANLLGFPQTFRGNFGETGNATNQPLSEDSRPQVSRSWNGDKMFFTWFDTDTVQYNGLGNAYPNMWGAGYDVTTGNTTPATNYTGGTSADGSCMYSSVSYYVFDNAGTYTIPAVYCLLNGVTPGTNVPLGTGSQVNFNYVNGATLADADFAASTDTVTLVADISSGVYTQTAATFTVSANYPNPVTGTTSFDVNLLNNSDVTLEVSNVLGQNMLSQSFSNMTSGAHTFTIDASKYAAGVYNYTIQVGNYKVTNKMVVK